LMNLINEQLEDNTNIFGVETSMGESSWTLVLREIYVQKIAYSPNYMWRSPC
jgi:hypothetical protein